MRRTPLNLIIQQQIKKELNKYLKTINVTPLAKASEVQGVDSNLQTNQNNIEKFYMPIIFSLFKQRIISGSEPIKLGTNTLYINAGVVLFNEESPDFIDGITFDVPVYLDDRWVWVYLCDDKTYIANKYAPMIGDNKNRIPICKVWKEHDSVDFDAKLIRDIRPVGIASGNVNHVVRQIILNLHYGIPVSLYTTISVIPKSGMVITVGSTDDNILYGRLAPIPDTDVTITAPAGSGEIKDYYVIAKAVVDNYDPDDFTWEFTTKESIESLEIYEIPVALIKDVATDTTIITTDMIKTIGYQKTQHDYYNEKLEYKVAGTISNEYIDVAQLVSYQGKISRISILLETFEVAEALSSGDVIKLNIKIYNNSVQIKSIDIDYDSSSESNRIHDELVSLSVFPSDIIKVYTTVTTESGYTITVEGLDIKLFASKISY